MQRSKGGKEKFDSSKEWRWEQTRELFTDWVAEWPTVSGFKKYLLWDGFPIWWVTNLVQKDAFTNNAWYIELHRRLKGERAKRFRPKNSFFVLFRLLLDFLKHSVFWLLVRSLPPKKAISEKRIWFHGLEYNIIESKGLLFDRMYEGSYLLDEKFDYTSGFLVRLNFNKADILRHRSWRRKISSYHARFERDLVFLDSYLRYSDIVEIYISIIKNYIKFLIFWGRKSNRKITVGAVEFSDIVFSELQNSFLGIIPWSLLYAAMFQRWLDEQEKSPVIVNYGETLSPIRAVNYKVQNHISKPIWVTIQHATAYRNKLGLYHRYSEFNKLPDNSDDFLSPMPDYYFIHGKQFEDILREYYPKERIVKIGCLKYDSLYALKREIRKSKKKPIRGTNVLVLAPSIGDEEMILRLFSGLDSIDGWRLVLSKHPIVPESHIKKIIDENDIRISLDRIPSMSTKDLIPTSTAVLTGFSGIALESVYLGVPAIRVLDPDIPPAVEQEPGIPWIETQSELLDLLRHYRQKPKSFLADRTIDQTIQDFFFKIDGKVAERFWINLDTIIKGKV
ncbi:hypothetical protein LEP1GSC047_2686 [Leptospira inadai serovar Lyme str. 10]|uniref:Uncharacterized protein n=2 Tax=Leptospira inadai serovar Lyme TaxID=293084 RepID=V6HD51_9LEPT|nr:hypothetical protein [Leptospira inadai]EQA36928.1 hypothetical protein LEP1GSC047_2686 [Leptospira inadai serovar Lyme str. 10]PNV75840.1 hypothetical protein BES34_007375 [Leptospira inadai serovar Lyme]